MSNSTGEIIIKEWRTQKVSRETHLNRRKGDILERLRSFLLDLGQKDFRLQLFQEYQRDLGFLEGKRERRYEIPSSSYD